MQTFMDIIWYIGATTLLIVTVMLIEIAYESFSKRFKKFCRNNKYIQAWLSK